MKEKINYYDLVTEELIKLKEQKFTGRAVFIFDCRDGGISNLSLEIHRNLTKEEKSGINSE